MNFTQTILHYLGTWLLGIMINMTGYISGTEVQSAAAAHRLGLLFTTMPSVFIVVCAILIIFLNVGKANAELENA